MSPKNYDYPHIVSVRIIVIPDNEGDISYLDSQEDAEKIEAYNRGEWEMIGIQAVAQIILTPETVVQVITSGGLFGIESNSSKQHLEEIGKEELNELFNQLQAIGDWSIDDLSSVWGDETIKQLDDRAL